MVRFLTVFIKKMISALSDSKYWDEFFPCSEDA